MFNLAMALFFSIVILCGTAAFCLSLYLEYLKDINKIALETAKVPIDDTAAKELSEIKSKLNAITLKLGFNL